jgi:hypothetical protein
MPRRSAEGAKAGSLPAQAKAGDAGSIHSRRRSQIWQKLRQRTAPRSVSSPFSRVSDGPSIAPAILVAGDRRFVYVLKNVESTPRFYIGLTSDVDEYA